LAHYLEYGKEENQNRVDDPSERVAWRARSRGVKTDRATVVWEMGLIARRNDRVKKPVYHLVVSWDSGNEKTGREGDSPSPTEMQEAGRVFLNDLGLEEHQAWMVGHKDTDTPHMHVMANRVHPRTDEVWTRDYDVIQCYDTCRKLEREYGWTQPAPNRIEDLWDERRDDSLEYWEVVAYDKFDRDLSLRRAARVVLGDDLAQATSWPELEEKVSKYNATLEPRRERGMVITYGDYATSLSKVKRSASRPKLERRIGQSYERYQQLREKGWSRERIEADAKIARSFRKEPQALGSTKEESLGGWVQKEKEQLPVAADRTDWWSGQESGATPLSRRVDQVVKGIGRLSGSSRKDSLGPASEDDSMGEYPDALFDEETIDEMVSGMDPEDREKFRQILRGTYREEPGEGHTEEEESAEEFSPEEARSSELQDEMARDENRPPEGKEPASKSREASEEAEATESADGEGSPEPLDEVSSHASGELPSDRDSSSSRQESSFQEGAPSQEKPSSQKESFSREDASSWEDEPSREGEPYREEAPSQEPRRDAPESEDSQKRSGQTSPDRAQDMSHVLQQTTSPIADIEEVEREVQRAFEAAYEKPFEARARFEEVAFRDGVSDLRAAYELALDDLKAVPERFGTLKGQPIGAETDADDLLPPFNFLVEEQEDESLPDDESPDEEDLSFSYLRRLRARSAARIGANRHSELIRLRRLFEQNTGQPVAEAASGRVLSGFRPTESQAPSPDSMRAQIAQSVAEKYTEKREGLEEKFLESVSKAYKTPSQAVEAYHQAASDHGHFRARRLLVRLGYTNEDFPDPDFPDPGPIRKGIPKLEELDEEIREAELQRKAARQALRLGQTPARPLQPDRSVQRKTPENLKGAGAEKRTSDVLQKHRRDLQSSIDQIQSELENRLRVQRILRAEKRLRVRRRLNDENDLEKEPLSEKGISAEALTSTPLPREVELESELESELQRAGDETLQRLKATARARRAERLRFRLAEAVERDRAQIIAILEKMYEHPEDALERFEKAAFQDGLTRTEAHEKAEARLYNKPGSFGDLKRAHLTPEDRSSEESPSSSSTEDDEEAPQEPLEPSQNGLCYMSKVCDPVK
jgi:hypothetical protein